MGDSILRALAVTLMLLPAAAFGQGERPACALMKGLDLKQLLGADHDAPVPFGQDSCRAESNAPGKLIVLGVIEGKPAELKTWLSGIKQGNATERAKEVTVVAEPALGPDAFSVRQQRDMRELEIYASKGTRVIVLQVSWPRSAPIGDAGLKQFLQLTKLALDKLP